MDNIKNLNWYPGHMKKTRELIASNLKLVDAVIEVCDARIPVSSRNPIIDDLVGAKPRIIVLNKSDLADETETQSWVKALSSKKAHALAMNNMAGQGVKQLIAEMRDLDSKKTKERSIRLMIVGVPNSGKSSLINRLTGHRSAATGDKPGVTRGKQWLMLENGMQLLDTPGILWPKFEDPSVGLALAFCGSIRDEIMDSGDLALELLKLLIAEYPDDLENRYGIGLEAESAENGPVTSEYAVDVMERIALKRGFILPGKKIDYTRTGRTLLDEFRAGKLGRITLEQATVKP